MSPDGWGSFEMGRALTAQLKILKSNNTFSIFYPAHALKHQTNWPTCISSCVLSGSKMVQILNSWGNSFGHHYQKSFIPLPEPSGMTSNTEMCQTNTIQKGSKYRNPVSGYIITKLHKIITHLSQKFVLCRTYVCCFCLLFPFDTHIRKFR